jgi:hypothetical protein
MPEETSQGRGEVQGEDMKEIFCKNGELALCDDEDYPLLSRFTWYMGSAGVCG